ncbi:tetratricopeptide repeat protein [Wenzhouxiangella sp. XN201]|uniref:tetratricopeptide repeat protein n=1 Tax=Wenzhouxiangella sp. XN201 TaxID=2710755 RepID=UPI0013C5CB34|nr:tetratricopeptide repeat protein [Wenzhouxiangella sp. XN201]NEZ03278.1 tetratricopeptide repeat protein [Wenzhouxiangella sp. XN201]
MTQAGADDNRPAPYPLSQSDYSTTSGAIYLSNLNATIEALTDADDTAGRPVELATQLYHRYRILGRLTDGERALDLVEQNVGPDASATALLRRASIRAGFHRFAGARRDLEAARDRGAPAATVDRLDRELRLAQGEYDSFGEDWSWARQPAAGFYDAAFRGNVSVLLGQLETANLQFFRAQQQYRDSNPFPLAWLYTQQGIALVRNGEFERAIPYLEAALQRVPGFYVAAEHLAECQYETGALEQARLRYRQVIEQTDDPAFRAALAKVEEALGNTEHARALRDRAMADYERLLAAHPAAYGGHAIDFLIEQGRVDRALALARQNRSLRADIGSRISLAVAAQAAGEEEQACRALEDALATGLNPPELSDLKGLSEGCGVTLPVRSERLGSAAGFFGESGE